MSIRGSLQSIRDQLGKINTILDASKSKGEEAEENHAETDSGDRPPVAHTPQQPRTANTIEDLYGARPTTDDSVPKLSPENIIGVGDPGLGNDPGDQPLSGSVVDAPAPFESEDADGVEAGMMPDTLAGEGSATGSVGYHPPMSDDGLFSLPGHSDHEGIAVQGDESGREGVNAEVSFANQPMPADVVPPTINGSDIDAEETLYDTQPNRNDVDMHDVSDELVPLVDDQFGNASFDEARIDEAGFDSTFEEAFEDNAFDEAGFHREGFEEPGFENIEEFGPTEDFEYGQSDLPSVDAGSFAHDYSGGSMIDEVAMDPILIDETNDSLDAATHAAGIVEETPIAMVGPDGLRITDRVVNRLLKRGLVSEKQVQESWQEWTSLKEEGYSLSLWRVLTLHPDLKREMVFEEAALVYAFEKATVSRSDAIAFIEKAVPIFEGDRLDRMLDLFVIPIAKEKDARTGDVKWLFVTHDPTRPEAHKLLRELGIKRFELRYWAESIIEDVITAGVLTKNVYLDRLNDDPMVYDLGTNFDKAKEELVNEEELENEINRSSLINLFEAVLVEAVNKGASDIHIFPNPDHQIEIHFRIDGHLELWHKEERISCEAFLAVVKDKSQNVDRFEKDTAQDGFIQRPVSDTTIRYRVSILPIASHKPGSAAESIVIRVLDDRKVLSDLRKVGMLDQAMTKFEQAIHQPHGMIILTGPTGSGKSTTLVAALHQVITPKVNVLTIEDPVEYLIKGVRQVKLSHHLSMDGALRALLRHDPDVVMVGEMRDKETAELAIKLANTGHLTFSTLHTNDAPSAVSRLYKMGIEPFLIAYAINIIVAQRLIRTLCPACKVETEPRKMLLEVLGFSEEEIESHTFFGPGKNDSCETCNGIGYKGRRAVAETLYFSDAIRAQIIRAGEEIDEKVLRDIASSEGMLSLQECAKEIAKEGDTSIEEVVRITGQ